MVSHHLFYQLALLAVIWLFHIPADLVVAL